jgi:alkylation response protein AidB-like acyl-CoA dehydrogenase
MTRASTTVSDKGFLGRERAALARFMPGLAPKLEGVPLEELEQAGSEAIAAFRDCGGPALLIPCQHGGAGASPVDAILAQRAIGYLAPSLAISTAMHHFSVATLVELDRGGGAFEWMLLEGIAANAHLVASGFAEGRAGASILSPTMQADRRQGTYHLNGVKKPCSLSRSMDLLTVSVALPEGGMGVAIISADAPGVSVHPFWRAPVLAGAESDEVRLSDVQVEEQLIVRIDRMVDGRLEPIEASGFLWFELLITASYVGVASALVDRVLKSDRASTETRARLIIELEGSMSALEGIAHAMGTGERGEWLLTRSLLVRYACQGALVRAASLAAEVLGGLAFMQGPDVSYLLAAAHALAFHPPQRERTAGALVEAMSGDFLRVG